MTLKRLKLIDPKVFAWNAYSDQPEKIRDKRAKYHLYLLGLPGLVRTLFSCLMLPWLALYMLTRKKTRAHDNAGGVGLAINLESPLDNKKVLSAQEILEMIRPLNLRRLAIRVPLHDLDNLESYAEFIRAFSDYEILVVILQTRALIEDQTKLRAAFARIFAALDPQVSAYQIGNAVNRRKWGFISQDEYFDFFRAAWDVRNKNFPHLQLLGGAVIDFELYEYARSLFNRRPFRFDAYASLLYVDRRGAPENLQFGCDLLCKIRWLDTMLCASAKLATRDEKKLCLTEFNWPLADTKPYAPASGRVLVCEQQQANYLARFYLLALASGRIETCYWHQLVAPGYGLVDVRGGKARKRPAFYAFKTLAELFNGARIEKFVREKSRDGATVYALHAVKGARRVRALWTREARVAMRIEAGEILDQVGDTVSPVNGEVTLSPAVVYVIE